MRRRVYWNGVFPNKKKQGTVLRTGKIRHEVLWDGAEKSSLEYKDALATVRKDE